MAFCTTEGHFSFIKHTVRSNYAEVYLSLAFQLLYLFTAHAVIQEQQWHHWFGNISVMEFEINNLRTTAGEVLTLTCTGGTLALAYSVPAEDYRVSSLTGLAEPVSVLTVQTIL
jgi:hypothetical protein